MTSCDSSVIDPRRSEQLTPLTDFDEALDVGQAVPLLLRVSDVGDDPISGVVVLWTVAGAGSVEPMSVSGEDGIASTTLIVGRGENWVTARVQGSETRLDFVVDGCLRCGKWTLVPLSSSGRAWATAGVIDGRLLVVGGFDGQASSSIDVFDPEASLLTHLAHLPKALGGSTAAVIEGQLYVIGGFSDESVASGAKSVFAFDPATGQWSEKAPLYTGLFLGAGAVLNGRIYVAGGRIGCGYPGYCQGPLADLNIYDPVADRWTQGPRMNEARALAGAAALDGKLYVAGGAAGESWWYDPSAGLSSVEMYDPTTNTWMRRAPLRVSGPVQLAASNGTLYAFSWNEEPAHSRVYEYDSASDRWTRLRNPPVSLIGPAVASADGRLYVFGGYELDMTGASRRPSQRILILTH